MSELIISSNGLSATVDTTGAWLTSLSISATSETNTQILFPKQELVLPGGQTKTRGGLHVCSPYFGPSSKDATEPQHGYARDVEWDINFQDTDFVTMSHILRQKNSRFNNLKQQLSFVIEESSQPGYDFQLDCILRLNASGMFGLPPMIKPGFHPYFRPIANLTLPADIPITSRAWPKDNNSEEEFALKSGLRVKLIGKNLPEITTWSDLPEEYACIEPVGGIHRPVDSAGDFAYILSLLIGV